jgi:pimeloyl-ACP methyl ester carboxylesterase
MSENRHVHADTVVLVPGFLGFSIMGQLSYFADRVVGALTGALRERWERDVSVVPASTVPTGKLKERIANLVWFLRDLRDHGAERFYLVGHSTGGVDAQLLMTELPFWGGEWSNNVREVQAMVRAVTTISAPHYGTALLDSPAGKFVAHPLQDLQGALPFARAGAALLDLVGKDAGTLFDLHSLQFPDAARFVGSVVTHHELLDELSPASMLRVRQLARADARARLTCFVSGADVRKEGPRRSDPFYARMNAFGFAATTLPPEPVLSALTRIENASEIAWIQNPEAPRFRLKAGTNDGVVNTSRQLLPEAMLGGIIVGDHADVLGYYDRMDLATGHATNTGLFRSGADFGDDQFFSLYQKVAESLGPAAAVQQSSLPQAAAHAA